MGHIEFDVLKTCFCTLRKGNRHFRLDQYLGTFCSTNRNFLAREGNVVRVRLYVSTCSHFDDVACLSAVQRKTQRISIRVGDVDHRCICNQCYQHRCKEREKFSHDTLI